MKIVAAALTFCLLAMTVTAIAGPPDVEAIRKGVYEAAGGLEEFKQLGVLQLAISQEETLSNGEQRKKQATAYVDARTLTNMRLELPGNIVVGRHGDMPWATRDGVLDDRPQTPKMALATLDQRLFPLLLPFTLAMEGVRMSDPKETSFEGIPSWRIAVDFPQGFFVVPSMMTTWYLHVRRSDHTVLAIEFIPPPGVREVSSEGIRYRYLKRANLGSSIQLPVQVLLDGIDLNGAPTGHVRVTRMRITIRGAYEPALFLHPVRLQAIEEGME